MTLDQAMQWARSNAEPEAVARLRSRAAAKALMDEVERLRGIVSGIEQDAATRRAGAIARFAESLRAEHAARDK